MTVDRCSEVYGEGRYGSFVLDRRVKAGLVEAFHVAQPQGVYPHPATDELWIGVQLGGQGGANLKLGGAPFSAEISPNDVIVRLPGCDSHYEFDHAHSYLLLSIPRGVAPSAAAERFYEYSASHAALLKDTPLSSTALAIWEALRSSSSSAELFIGSALSFAVDIIEAEIADGRIESSESGLTGYQRRTVERYISSNLSQDISLADLAGSVKLSHFHFSRLFKATYGHSPYSYVIDCKMRAARESLLSDAQNVKALAADLGFSNVASFSRCFKKAFGVSPRQFKAGRVG